MSVRLTTEGALLVRWIYNKHQTITPELVEAESSIERAVPPAFCPGEKDKAIVLSALDKIGADGVLALAHATDVYIPAEPPQE